MLARSISLGEEIAVSFGLILGKSYRPDLCSIVSTNLCTFATVHSPYILDKVYRLFTFV